MRTQQCGGGKGSGVKSLCDETWARTAKESPRESAPPHQPVLPRFHRCQCLAQPCPAWCGSSGHWGQGESSFQAPGMKETTASPSGCSSSGPLGRRGGHLEGQGDPARAQHAEITKQAVLRKNKQYPGPLVPYKGHSQYTLVHSKAETRNRPDF